MLDPILGGEGETPNFTHNWPGKPHFSMLNNNNNNNNHGSEATKGLGAMAYKAHNWPLKPMIFLKVIYISVCMCEDNI